MIWEWSKIICCFSHHTVRNLCKSLTGNLNLNGENLINRWSIFPPPRFAKNVQQQTGHPFYPHMIRELATPGIGMQAPCFTFIQLCWSQKSFQTYRTPDRKSYNPSLPSVCWRNRWSCFKAKCSSHGVLGRGTLIHLCVWAWFWLASEVRRYQVINSRETLHHYCRAKPPLHLLAGTALEMKPFGDEGALKLGQQEVSISKSDLLDLGVGTVHVLFFWVEAWMIAHWKSLFSLSIVITCLGVSQ